MTTAMLTLRRAEPADAAAVRTLTRDAYAKWVPVIGREPKPMTANYDTAVRLNRIDLAHVDGELAGLIETIDRSDHLLIENVAVAPARHGTARGSDARCWRMPRRWRAPPAIARCASTPTRSSPRT